jgi:hypothetical protein
VAQYPLGNTDRHTRNRPKSMLENGFEFGHHRHFARYPVAPLPLAGPEGNHAPLKVDVIPSKLVDLPPPVIWAVSRVGILSDAKKAT